MSGHEDTDQDESFKAVTEQAQQCELLLEKMREPNARILARAASGDTVWQRMAKERYNNVCRECAARRDNPGVADAYWDTISVDADLKAVCDDRWKLGETVDVLRSRLNRLGTIATPYEDFEVFMRKAVTNPDRSPAELDEAIKEALRLARQAASWAPPTPPNGETLVDRWIRYLKNNPVIAAVILAAMILSAIGGLYKALPSSWTAGIVALFVELWLRLVPR